MSTLKFVGRPPDSDFSVVHKKYTQARYDTVKVDSAYINSQIALIAPTLVSQSYVDTQDSQRSSKAAADAADAGYLLATQRGVTSGIAPIASDGYIPSANLPTLQTERKPTYTVASTTFLTTTRNVTTTNAKEYQAATMNIADPGYPYYPLCFALIRGGAINVTQNPSRSMGTPSYGQVSILAADNTKYSWCICNSRKVYDYHLAMPFADTTINPTTRPPVEGALTLNLWLGLWGGSIYTFDATGLQFFSINIPAA